MIPHIRSTTLVFLEQDREARLFFIQTGTMRPHTLQGAQARMVDGM